MEKKAFQEQYPEIYSYCYGCGTSNPQGLRIKSYWEGDESICKFTPRPYHTAFPGFVYGGLLASIIDCHGTGTAAAAAYRAEGREMDSIPPLRFVTASLHVDYIKPTPIDTELVLKGRVKEIKGKKVIIAIDLYAKNEICVKGEIVAVQIPEVMRPKS